MLFDVLEDIGKEAPDRPFFRGRNRLTGCSVASSNWELTSMDSVPKSLVGTIQSSDIVIVDRGILAGLQGKVVSRDGSRLLILIKAGIYVQIEEQLLEPVYYTAGEGRCASA